MADRISELERQQNTTDPQPLSQTSASTASSSLAINNSAPNGAQHRPSYQQPPPTIQSGSTSQQRFTFLDPSKTTRISNPALKAFQKNAVQSYFERQQLSHPREQIAASNGAGAVTTRQSLSGAVRPQSLPVASSCKPLSITHQASHTRSSLPSNYAAHQTLPSQPSPAATGGGGGASPAQSSHSSPVLAKHQTAVVSQASPASQALVSPTYQAAYKQAAATFNGCTAYADAADPMMTTSMSAVSEYRGTICDDFMNESGVPPPPPRRNRSVPVRR